MNRQDLTKVTITFAALFVVSLSMLVFAQRWAPVDVQQVLIHVGSAIMGGTLAFYLVQMFDLERASRK